MRHIGKLLLIILVSSMLGCGGNKANEAKKELTLEHEFPYEYDYEFVFPTEFDNYTAEQISFKDKTVTAYSLDQFVVFDGERDEYDYEIVAEDDYSPRITMPYDLKWEKFKTGYFIPDEGRRTYFSEKGEELPFNVKNAHKVRLYKITETE